MTATTDRELVAIDMRDYLSGTGALFAGMANVIMQLSWPGVGYGVMESKVESGRITDHPVKRSRTTFTFLAVSMLGNERDRAVFRKAVNRQHAQVRSTPDSPVEYNAFDKDLQMWVAACLYYGTADVGAKLGMEMSDAEADALYAHCARFGTTLQVPQEMWPADRAAFDRYWEEGLAKVSIDEPVRNYLTSLMQYGYAARGLQRAFGRFNTFVTTGFLPPVIREQMQLSWDVHKQERFDRLMLRVGKVNAALPRPLRVFPFNALLRDMRRRQRRGQPLV